jgi:hypothetical protein
MTWAVNDQEFESVTRLSAEARYDYFIKRAASFGELWGLVEDDPEARSGTSFLFVEGPAEWWYMPVWPHPRFAEAWADAERREARPQAIDVDAWVTYWTQRAVADGIKPLVFPAREDPGHLVGPRELQRDLLEELSLFEAE